MPWRLPACLALLPLPVVAVAVQVLRPEGTLVRGRVLVVLEPSLEVVSPVALALPIPNLEVAMISIPLCPPCSPKDAPAEN